MTVPDCLLQMERDALRYRWLRARDVDTIRRGGVFAGRTPENIVINGEDLDRHVDEAMAAEQASVKSTSKPECHDCDRTSDAMTERDCTYCPDLSGSPLPTAQEGNDHADYKRPDLRPGGFA